VLVWTQWQLLFEPGDGGSGMSVGRKREPGLKRQWGVDDTEIAKDIAPT
jgi:hypothetical protein